MNDGGSPIQAFWIYRGPTPGSLSFLGAVGPVLSFPDLGVTNGATYFYAVSGVNAIGEGALSDVTSATPAAAPAAPRSLQATADVERAALLWLPPLSDGGSPVTSYRLYRGTAPGSLAALAEIASGTSFTDAPLGAGVTYYYEVTAVNARGEGPASSQVSVTPFAPGDTTAPDLVITSPSTDLTRQSQVTVAGWTEVGATVTVNGGPVAVAGDGTFSIPVPLVEGANTILVTATDPSANSRSATISITMDSTPPSLSVTGPTAGAWINTNVVRVTGTASDTGSSLAQISVDGVVLIPTSPWTANLAMLDGAHTITVTATDRAGNTATSTVTITVDTVPPPLSLSSPTTDLTTAGTATVAGTTEAGAQVAVNGVPVSVSGSGTFSTSVTLTEGANGISVTATDAAGNVATIARSVTRDSTPPAITLIAPANGASTNVSTIVVSGTTEPGARLVVNGIAVAVAVDGTFNAVVSLSQGTNAIVATATDAAGNSRSASVSVTYTNPVSSLEQQLHDLQQQLQDTKDKLTQTNQALQDSQTASAAANASVGALGTELILGLVAVIVILAVLQLLLFRKMQAKPPSTT